MSSKLHTDEVYKKKRVPKNPIKFNVQLNEEQKEAKEIILNNTITVIKGKAGSGKSLLAAQIALNLLYTDSDIEKIIIARPVITAGEEVGFLPGNIADKMAPFTAPVYDNMNRLESKEKIKSLVDEGKIEVIPIAFLRGYNFTNSVVIIDEAQNCNLTQLELILGRICLGSKVIICGDAAQIDLKKKADSGFDVLYKHFKDVPSFAIVNLQTNHRHPIVEDILKVFAELRS